MASLPSVYHGHQGGGNRGQGPLKEALTYGRFEASRGVGGGVNDWIAAYVLLRMDRSMARRYSSHIWLWMVDEIVTPASSRGS